MDGIVQRLDRLGYNLAVWAFTFILQAGQLLLQLPLLYIYVLVFGALVMGMLLERVPQALELALGNDL